jgi:hypothetical protein
LEEKLKHFEEKVKLLEEKQILETKLRNIEVNVLFKRIKYEKYRHTDFGDGTLALGTWK